MTRRTTRGLVAAAFALQFVILDLLIRPGEFASRTAVHTLAVRLASVCLWAGLLRIARGRTARVGVAIVASVVLVVQGLVFRYYHTPLDVQVAATAMHAFRDVRPVLVRLLPTAFVAGLFTFGCELALLSIVHARLHTGAVNTATRRFHLVPTTTTLFASALTLVCLGRARDATPEIAAAHAVSAIFTVRPTESVGAAALPPLLSRRKELPDVLVVLTESVRTSDYVSTGPLPTAAESLALTQDRVDFAEMRAVSSYTAVSLSALLTGRSQEGSREAILRAPNLFDVALATRGPNESRFTVLYVSAHSETVFEAKDVRGSVDRFITVESMLGRDIDDAEYVTLPLDENATAELERMLREVRTPVFAFLHLAGTHAPYFVDEKVAPFRPYSHVVTWSGMPELHNAYKNAIVAQDRSVARAVRALSEHAGSRPRVVIFTSDHGEAFGEHGAIHHGQNLYDEQIHVPAWIWASPEALTPDEAAALAASERRFSTHLDVLPTILDLLGLGDNTALRAVREELAGASLLRPPPATVSVPLTNCTGMFPCPLDTWGLLSVNRKLVAQRWDRDWGCFDLDGTERPAPPEDPACQQLRASARDVYPTLPNGRPNR